MTNFLCQPLLIEKKCLFVKNYRFFSACFSTKKEVHRGKKNTLLFLLHLSHRNPLNRKFHQNFSIFSSHSGYNLHHSRHSPDFFSNAALPQGCRLQFLQEWGNPKFPCAFLLRTTGLSPDIPKRQLPPQPHTAAPRRSLPTHHCPALSLLPQSPPCRGYTIR